jgi:hypothetical protein
MRSKVLGLVAAAALLGSMGAADAKQPLKLTDAQLDMATAGYATVGNYGFSTAGVGGSNIPVGLPLPQVSMAYSMNGIGTEQANQTTGANAVQQNSVATIIGLGPF